jgi:hypothetical protein
MTKCGAPKIAHKLRVKNETLCTSRTMSKMSFFAIDTPKAVRYDPPQGFRAQAATSSFKI